MIAGCAALVLAMLTASAPPVGPRYGDTLAANALARYHVVKGLRISAAARDGTPVVIAAGRPATGANAVLRDAEGHAIGTVTISGRSATDAARVAGYLSRRLYTAAGLVEPDPFVAGAPRSGKGQALVDAMLARFPDLVTLALHVGEPPAGRIVASSFGRIGKMNDADDERVAGDGAVLREITDGGARVAVELPLLDRAGRTIGALSTSFRMASGGGQDAAERRALAVRTALARAIPSAAVLDTKTDQ